MHEILTLQFGHEANFVGTHFWNMQETYFTYDASTEPLLQHDVFFRQGRAVDGSETYTPRALIFDLKGGFGSLKIINKLYESYEAEEASDTWSNVERHIQPVYPQNEYLKSLNEDEPSQARLDADTVQTWSDFNHMYYHPRSLIQLNSYMLESENMPFDTYTKGREAFEQLEHDKDTFDDHFRYFAEESDNLQGFHVISHISDGWSGFTTAYLERIRDEYPKTALLVHGIEQSGQDLSDQKMRRKLLNEMLFLTNMSLLSATTIPIGPIDSMSKQAWTEHLSLNSSRYHTSALIASNIETLLLPHQDRTALLPLFDRLERLNWRGNTPISHMVSAVPSVETELKQLLHDYTWSRPPKVGREQPLSVTTVVRGTTIKEDVLDNLYHTHEPFHIKHFSPLPLPRSTANPDIFTPPFNGTANVPVLASYKTTPRTHEWLKSRYLQHDLMKGPFQIVVPHDFTEGAYPLNEDTFREVLEELWSLAEAYDTEDNATDKEEEDILGTDEEY